MRGQRCRLHRLGKTWIGRLIKPHVAPTDSRPRDQLDRIEGIGTLMDRLSCRTRANLNGHGLE